MRDGASKREAAAGGDARQITPEAEPARAGQIAGRYAEEGQERAACCASSFICSFCLLLSNQHTMTFEIF